MRNLIAVGIIFSTIILFSGCVDEIKEEAPEEIEAELANPAAVKCQEEGFVYKIQEDVEGDQYGTCSGGTYPNGWSCDAWDYYDGDCP